MTNSEDPHLEEQDNEKFEQLIEQFDHAMLVSIANDGALHARPMAIAGHDGPMLRFATSRQSTKAAEIFYQPRVAVVAQGGGAFLNVSGDPEHAEYWDRSGLRRLEFLWEAGKALATGHRVDDQPLSGHHKFSFG